MVAKKTRKIVHVFNVGGFSLEGYLRKKGIIYFTGLSDREIEHFFAPETREKNDDVE